MKTAVAHTRLLELLHYDPGTGLFTWRVDIANVKAGSRAGTLSVDDGYMRTQIDGKRYLLHRLAWFYMTGEWPPRQLDHRNRARSDNRFDNLRPATNAQNCQNAGIRSDNTSGFTGVSRHESMWRADVAVDGVRHYLGRFATTEQAAAARAHAKALLHTFNLVVHR